MADISLRVRGEDAASSELRGAAAGVRGLGDSAEAVGKSLVKWTEIANATKAALRAIVDVTRESVKAYQEQEQADLRLKRVAGELTDAFKAQASALQESLGVSDDMVQGIQTMLLHFGEAPESVEATTRAILDFSAATGQDASAATRELLSGIESGRGAFKEYGVQVDLTGKASKDLEAATKALAAKFGGSAETEAGTLTGQVNLAKAAFGELEEAWGGVVSEFVKSTGVLEKLTSLMKDLAGVSVSKTGDSDAFRRQRFLDIQLAIDAAQGGQPVTIDGRQVSLEELLAQRQQLRMTGMPTQGPELRPMGLRGKDRTTRFGSRASAGGGGGGSAHLGADQDAAARAHQEQMELDAGWFSSWGDATKASEESKRFESAIREAGLRHRQAMDKADEEEAARIEQSTQRMMDAMREKSEQAYQTAAQVGAAMVAGVTDQLQRLMEGGDADPGEVFGNILATILGVAGSAIGMVLGGPAGATIGGSLAGLAGAGIKAATRAPKQHEGGWIGAPRYHSGGWPGLMPEEVPAVLQTGERVVSRGEVDRAGGPAALERMLGGGGGVTIAMNVSTMDGRSMREFIEDRGGQGLAEALRSGRGALAVAG